jgi:hypothetical protein
VKRSATLAAAAGLLLVACGASGGEDSQPSPTPQAESSSTESDTNSAASEQPAASTEPQADATAAETPATDSAASDNAETDSDGTDGREPESVEPPLAGMLGGRQLAEVLDDGSNVETNLLPDLLVDDVTREVKANLRNVFPAERPVLMWMWAPH